MAADKKRLAISFLFRAAKIYAEWLNRVMNAGSLRHILKTDAMLDKPVSKLIIFARSSSYLFVESAQLEETTLARETRCQYTDL